MKTDFIIRWSNKIEAGVQTDAMIEYVDVFPTLTELVNGTVLGKLDGNSFKAVITGNTTQQKEYVYGM